MNIVSVPMAFPPSTCSLPHLTRKFFSRSGILFYGWATHINCHGTLSRIHQKKNEYCEQNFVSTGMLIIKVAGWHTLHIPRQRTPQCRCLKLSEVVWHPISVEPDENNDGPIHGYITSNHIWSCNYEYKCHMNNHQYKPNLIWWPYSRDRCIFFIPICSDCKCVPTTDIGLYIFRLTPWTRIFVIVNRDRSIVGNPTYTKVCI